MAARVVHGFGAGVCEALPVQLVNDIFFLHERGKRIGYYTSTFHVLTCVNIAPPYFNHPNLISYQLIPSAMKREVNHRKR